MSMPEPANDPAAPEANPRFQFQLKTVLIVLTLFCVFLAVLRSWPERAVLAGVLILAALERIYRHRIKHTVGESNYQQIGSVLAHMGGAIAGCVVGAILGIVFAIVVFTTFDFHPGWLTSIKVGASCGFAIGLIYPRIAGSLFVSLGTFLPLL